MSSIKLIALDLDGTLFNHQSIITDASKEAIKKVTSRGVNVVISTGRPYSGIPFEQIEGLGIKYAITTNGAGVYEIPTQKEIHIDCLDNDVVFPIFDFLITKQVHMDAFLNGDAVSPSKCRQVADNLIVPSSVKSYIKKTRKRVDNLQEYMLENNYQLQKMTINFQRDENGQLIDREEIRQYLEANTALTVVSGGFSNLEFTKAGVDKGTGLVHLSNALSIPIEETMAIGDSENDIAILKAAGISVAMANAIDEVKELSDFVTLSNEEDGVAYAINHYLP